MPQHSQDSPHWWGLVGLMTEVIEPGMLIVCLLDPIVSAGNAKTLMCAKQHTRSKRKAWYWSVV